MRYISKYMVLMIVALTAASSQPVSAANRKVKMMVAESATICVNFLTSKTTLEKEARKLKFGPDRLGVINPSSGKIYARRYTMSGLIARVAVPNKSTCLMHMFDLSDRRSGGYYQNAFLRKLESFGFEVVGTVPSEKSDNFTVKLKLGHKNYVLSGTRISRTGNQLGGHFLLLSRK